MLRDPRELGTVLGVWAHPDDEAFLSGGVMASVAGNGGRVACVTATHGEAGFPGDDARSVAERKALRQAELEACLTVLGVSDHRGLGYPDGGCADLDDQEPVTRLVQILDDVRPDSVLTFGPDGMTGHPDHIAVGRWTTLACSRAARRPERLLYATKTRAWNEMFVVALDPAQTMMQEGLLPPETDVDELAAWFSFDGELLDRKVEALQRQASQTATTIGQVGIEAFRKLEADEFFGAPTSGAR
jgi:LmbE family N-acetylglucosaminyl deacetylase